MRSQHLELSLDGGFGPATTLPLISINEDAAVAPMVAVSPKRMSRSGKFIVCNSNCDFIPMVRTQRAFMSVKEQSIAQHFEARVEFSGAKGSDTFRDQGGNRICALSLVDNTCLIERLRHPRTN